MDLREAVAFLRPAVDSVGGVWADVGAGEGAFTRALAKLLGPRGHVLAMDRDPRAVAALSRLAPDTGSARVEAVMGDLQDLDAVASLRHRALDGVLLANVLHYLADPAPALAALAERLRPGGRLVVVEYDRRSADPWVPHPLPCPSLRAAAEAARLSPPRVVARLPSLYEGELYCAVMCTAASPCPASGHPAS